MTQVTDADVWTLRAMVDGIPQPEVPFDWNGLMHAVHHPGPPPPGQETAATVEADLRALHPQWFPTADGLHPLANRETNVDDHIIRRSLSSMGIMGWDEMRAKVVRAIDENVAASGAPDTPALITRVRSDGMGISVNYRNRYVPSRA